MVFGLSEGGHPTGIEPVDPSYRGRFDFHSWLLMQGYDAAHDENYLEVRDAETLDVTSRIWTGQHLPLGFHGNFTPTWSAWTRAGSMIPTINTADVSHPAHQSAALCSARRMNGERMRQRRMRTLLCMMFMGMAVGMQPAVACPAAPRRHSLLPSMVINPGWRPSVKGATPRQGCISI
jgi:hypothetical protein